MAKRNLFYLLFGATTGGGGGTDTSDATATSADIRLGKTAYGAEGKMTGIIPDYDGTTEPTSGKSLFAQLVGRSITEVAASDLEGVTRIGDYAFYQCTQLTKVVIPTNISGIGSNCFNNCIAMTGTYISDLTHWCNIRIEGNRSSPLTRSHNLYLNGSLITNLVIPDNVTRISDYVFEGGSCFDSVLIHDKVTAIGCNAFDGCTGLTTINLPNSLTQIRSATFQGCSGLVNVVIPETITNIDSYAFWKAGSKSSGIIYVIKASDPPDIQSTSFNSATINKIIVPKGSGDAYKAATNWSAWADYIEEAAE